MTDDEINTQALARVASISSVRLDKADGRVFLYVSLDYIPFWHLIRRHRYRRAVREHIDFARGDGKVFVECPAHPVPILRRRRCLKR